jgi:RNA polymerase sigma-B factor
MSTTATVTRELTAVTRELKSESLELLQNYQKTNSSRIRNRLVEMNLGLVRKEVHHWINQCNESFDDLLQVGSIGLIRAIERFDVSKGHAFSSFAVPYIRGEIQHYLRDKSPSVKIPRRWQDLQRQAISVIKALQIELNRQPNDMEIAAALGIQISEWLEIKSAKRNRVPLSLDAPVSGSEDGTTCLSDLVPDTQYRSFQLAQEDELRLRQALSQLEQRTCEILEFVFLHDLTQKETAEHLGISTVTVSRRVKKGLEALKGLLASSEDEV